MLFLEHLFYACTEGGSSKSSVATNESLLYRSTFNDSKCIKCLHCVLSELKIEQDKACEIEASFQQRCAELKAELEESRLSREALLLQQRQEFEVQKRELKVRPAINLSATIATMKMVRLWLKRVYMSSICSKCIAFFQLCTLSKFLSNGHRSHNWHF